MLLSRLLKLEAFLNLILALALFVPRYSYGGPDDPKDTKESQQQHVFAPLPPLAANGTAADAFNSFQQIIQDPYIYHVYQMAQAAYLKTPADMRMSQFF